MKICITNYDDYYDFQPFMPYDAKIARLKVK